MCLMCILSVWSGVDPGYMERGFIYTLGGSIKSFNMIFFFNFSMEMKGFCPSKEIK